MDKNGVIQKITREIDFPRDDLVFGDRKYTLSSIVHHIGSMSVGHYYASVLRNVEMDTWAIFNDDRITIGCNIDVMVPNVRSEVAGFFYVRKSSQGTSRGTLS